MAHDRRPRSLALFSVLLAVSAMAGVSILAQAPAAPSPDVTFSKDISRILQTSEGTVKSRISRARGFLREKMSAYF